YREVEAVDSDFFFSSRGRHTRFSRDWSSDVCSSDLPNGQGRGRDQGQHGFRLPPFLIGEGPIPPRHECTLESPRACQNVSGGLRSEERRVGKECSCPWGSYGQKRGRPGRTRTARRGA